MKQILRNISFLICLFTSLKTFAQDPYYTQFNMSQMVSNPASIGDGVGDMRLQSAIKLQSFAGISAFKYTTMSFEKKLDKLTNKDDQLTYGVLFSADESNGGLFKDNFFGVGLSFNKKLSERSKLSLGLLSVYSDRLLDPSQLQFQTQFGSFGFNNTLHFSNESAYLAKRTIFDADAGIKYYYTAPDDKWGFNAGTAVYHSATFYNSVFNPSSLNVILLPRYSSQFGTFYKLRNNDEMNFLLNYDQQGFIKILSLGYIYKASLPENLPISKVDLGVWNRYGTTLSPYMGLESKDWIFGLSYDMNLGSSSKVFSSNLQTIEIALSWKFNKSLFKGFSGNSNSENAAGKEGSKVDQKKVN